MLALSGVVALVIALVAGGFIWEQFILPSRPVAHVNQTTLTRRGYEQLQRNQLITQQIVQNLQLFRLFGNQNFGGQQGSFDQQVVQANYQLSSLGTTRSRREPVNDTALQQWVDQQLLEQGAQEQYQINPSQGQVDQALIAALGSFVSTNGVTGTNTLTGTNALSSTTGVTGTSSAASAKASTTATASVPPTATPLPDQATQQAGRVIDAVYTQYTNLVNQFAANTAGLTAAQRTPHMTRDELATALRDQFREQTVREQVSNKLVPTVPPEGANGPQFIQLRQIVLQVPPPQPNAGAANGTASITGTATLSGTNTLSNTGTISGTNGITDTAKLSPAQRDALFAQRLTEANSIVQELRAKPNEFATLAQQKSNDTATASQGGTVGLIDRKGTVKEGTTPLPQPVIDAAWALPDNGISAPIRTDNGWVIVQRQPEDPQARLQRLRQDALTSWLTQRRTNANTNGQISPAPSASASPSEGPTPFATETSGTETPGTKTTATP